jgi:hypothetical protein
MDESGAQEALMKPEESIAKDEVKRSVELPDVLPHQFQGRSDQDCLVCGKPDRNPIHKVAQRQEA